MPMKKRRNLHRADDFRAWACTLGTGFDFFGDLPADDLEEEAGNRRSCTPRVEAARAAWKRHGARFLNEKAARPGAFGNNSAWGLWAFGVPPGADLDALTVCVAQMLEDWEHSPDWVNRGAALDWREDNRQRLRRHTQFTGRVPELVTENFGALIG